MAKPSLELNIDLQAWAEQLKGQFEGLDPNEPGQWPLLPKIAAWLATGVATVFLGWFVFLSDLQNELQASRDREPQLREEYVNKLAQAVNLTELRKQKLQVEEYVTQLEKQLPGRAEMDALLSDINQAEIGRGLQFELFRPGREDVKDYYAELPVTLKVTGRYEELATFASDIANLSRIVTLHNITLLPAPGANAAAVPSSNGAILMMDATARTYRYLDAAEVGAKNKGKGKGKEAN